MTEVLPSVSTAGSRRTSALRFTIRCTPRASEIVTTAGSASGTTATASAMPKISISKNGWPRTRPSSHDQRDDHQGGAGQDVAHPVEVLLQGRAPALHGLQQARDLAELGLHAGGDDDRRPRP